MRTVKTSIVILTYNNLQYTKDCIQSIRKYTEKGSYRIIIVDNNSTDGTREWLNTLKDQKDIIIKLNDTNAGFPVGCNIGIQLADKTDDILLLNNDTVVTTNWLSNLRRCLYSADDIGAVGAVSTHHENLQGLDLKYDTLEKMQELAKENNISDPNRWEQKVFLIGFCMLIKREALDKTGLLDENYSPGYVEDNDYSLRLIKSGYRLMLCYDCFVHHYLGTNFRKNLDEFYKHLYKNRDYFTNKWGFSVFAFDDVKHASLRQLKEVEKDRLRPVNVLDINCGIGVNLLKIKYHLPNAKLYGTEILKGCRNIASEFAEVYAVAPEAINSLPKEHFDYIFLGNYLEKTASTHFILKSARQLLKPEGVLLAEFKNLIHYDVIKQMLKGSFITAYSPIGPSKSNRTFFAPDDITNIFNECGFTTQFLHWYTVPNDKELEFIHALGKLVDEPRTYLYRTHMFTVTARIKS